MAPCSTADLGPYIILSNLCPSSLTLVQSYPNALQGINVILVDDPFNETVQRLLALLKVTHFPTVRVGQCVHSGQDALNWAASMTPTTTNAMCPVAHKDCGSSLADISTLAMLSGLQKGQKPIV